MQQNPEINRPNSQQPPTAEEQRDARLASAIADCKVLGAPAVPIYIRLTDDKSAANTFGIASELSEVEVDFENGCVRGMLSIDRPLADVMLAIEALKGLPEVDFVRADMAHRMRGGSYLP
jgi:hypothetical protein